MDHEPKPVPPEALVGKDELDEDDEMELVSADLVDEEPDPPGPAAALGHGPL